MIFAHIKLFRIGTGIELSVLPLICVRCIGDRRSVYVRSLYHFEMTATIMGKEVAYSQRAVICEEGDGSRTVVSIYMSTHKLPM